MSTAYFFKHSRQQIGVQTLQNKHGKPLTKCFTWNINPADVLTVLSFFESDNAMTTRTIIDEHGEEYTRFQFIDKWAGWDYQFYDKLEPPA